MAGQTGIGIIALDVRLKPHTVQIVFTLKRPDLIRSLLIEQPQRYIAFRLYDRAGDEIQVLKLRSIPYPLISRQYGQRVIGCPYGIKRIVIVVYIKVLFGCRVRSVIILVQDFNYPGAVPRKSVDLMKEVMILHYRPLPEP